MLYNMLRKFYLFLFWSIKSKRLKLQIGSFNISSKVKVGKYVRIRKGCELGADVEIGDYSYISGPRSYVEAAQIGKYCSIARQVVIGVSDHNYKWVSTHPFLVESAYNIIRKDICQQQKLRPIIGNDVWIGINCIIARGVKVGDGAVIAAGSIVTKDVAPYSIVGGIPARHIKYRFEEHICQYLIDIKWWDWDEKKIIENIDMFYNIERFITKEK